MILLWLIAVLAVALLSAGVVWRARSQRPELYPELTRPLSTRPGRHKLVK
jgi:hypothetical protein